MKDANVAYWKAVVEKERAAKKTILQQLEMAIKGKAELRAQVERLMVENERLKNDYYQAVGQTDGANQ